MIFVKKNFNKPPAALRSPAVKAAIADLLANNNRDAIQSDLYRGRVVLPNGEVRFEVVEALMLLYHDKCAYCESKEFDPQVEHYRPKGRVTSAAGHTGYFWLAFEWSNLVSTCFDCNKVGRGKGNKFPMLAAAALRVKDPSLLPNGTLRKTMLRPDRMPLSAERPSLFHPELDKPENSFSFDNQGVMSGTDAEGRGNETIKICNLNRRNLLFRRQKNLDVFVDRIKDAFLAFGLLALPEAGFLAFMKLTFDKLKAWGNPTEEYSLFGRKAFENFPSMVGPMLPDEIRPIALKIFEDYKLTI